MSLIAPINYVYEEDNLTKETWVFRLVDSTIYLDEYILGKRESTKHRIYHTQRRYDRLNTRDSTISKEEVPLPKWLSNAIKEQFIDRVYKGVEVKKWDR